MEGKHWHDSGFLIGGSEHPAELWIFDRKDSLLRPCCSADYEKQHIFFLSKYKSSICAGKICYLAIYGFFPVGHRNRGEQQHMKGEEEEEVKLVIGEVKAAKCKTFMLSVLSAKMAGGWSTQVIQTYTSTLKPSTVLHDSCHGLPVTGPCLRSVTRVRTESELVVERFQEKILATL